MKPVILFLSANPGDTPRLTLAQEFEAIRDELDRSARRDDLVLYDGHAIDRAKLAALVARRAPVLLHFAGHGTSDGLTLENGELAIADLVRLLWTRGDRRIPVVFLNTCYSDALADALLEIADCVVGMEGPVDDSDARAFAAAFYRGLVLAWPVAKAFERARNVLPTTAADGGTTRDIGVSDETPRPGGPRLRPRADIDPWSLYVLGPPDLGLPMPPTAPASEEPATWEVRLIRQGLRRLDRTAVPAVELTAALLRVTLFDDPGSAQQDLDDMALAVTASRLEAELATTLGAETWPERVSVSVMRQLLDVLERATALGTLRPGAIALLAARAADARFGPQFREYFRHVRPLQPRDPYPIVRHPSRPCVAAYDRVTHLGIASEAVNRLSICIVNVVDAVPPRVGSSSMGAAITNTVIRPELDWHTYHVGGRRAFYGVAPTDVVVQRERVNAALTGARAHGVNVVVFPELVITHELLEELRAARAFDDTALVITGSYHEPRPVTDAGRNVTVVLARGQVLGRHFKFAASSYAEGDQRCYEHLLRRDPEAGFDLLIGAGCSIVALTREDVMHARAVIDELSPTMVLVVATEQHGDDLGPLADVLPTNGVSGAVVACAGGGAAFRVAGASVRPPAVRGLSAPTLVVCEPSGKVKQHRIDK